uniref:Uncharacterized protein n=1 Tax=Anguilla anguilla TaxID=7936 RepID=A0A0E9R7I1_ANGAN
MLLLWLFTKL